MGFSTFVMVIEFLCLPAQIEAPATPSVRIEAPARLHFFVLGSVVVLVTLLETSFDI